CGKLRDRLGACGHVCRFLLTAGTEHERDLALRGLREFRRELASTAARDLLVSFRQLTANGELAIRIGRRKRAQRRRQPARGLEGNRGPGPRRQLLPRSPEPLLSAWQKADELVALGRKTARDQRGVDRGRARKNSYRHPGVQRRADEPRSGIGDAGQPRVGDERDSLAGLEPRQYLGG